MMPRWLKWFLGEIADWVMLIWLLGGLAAIIYFLSANLVLCIAVSVAFVGVTLFVYFKIARAK